MEPKNDIFLLKRKNNMSIIPQTDIKFFRKEKY